ncbi:MAG: divalent metal cation transporter, partial [Planctomycetota bacterium]
DKPFRGLTIFDLCTGTFIPFVLATGCIVVASAQQFHAQLPDGVSVSESGEVAVPANFQGPFDKMLAARTAAAEAGNYELGEPDNGERQMAAALLRRDTFNLAKSLEKLFAADGSSFGGTLANIVFGIGVVGMTLSSISLMMLISGFVVCEVLDRPPTGWIFRLGCMCSAVGVLWPLLWDGDARAWLTVIAGVYGAMLLPIAYITFSVMMNQRSLLGDDVPTGMWRVVWNVLMAAAAIAASAAGVSAVWKKAGTTGLVFVALYVGLVIAVQVAMPSKPTTRLACTFSNQTTRMKSSIR